ncbi:MAG TPA: MATE family efflux transporter [Myxococcales bacterium]|nr:MATE family efflux transporter [Myxococcales bacterium]
MSLPLEPPIRDRPQAEEEARTQDALLHNRPLGQRARPGSLKEVSLLAYPAILTQLSGALMGVVDSAMVGRLGATELAGVGFGGTWIWTLFCFFIGMATGVQTFVAQNHGAGKNRLCGVWAWHGLLLLLPITALASLLCYAVMGPVLSNLISSKSMISVSTSYMSIRTLGVVGMVAAMVLSAFFRGISDTRTPLYVTLFANGLNIVLDYGLIFGRLGLPEWGVEGAAAATVISEWVFAFVILGVFLRPALREKYGTARIRLAWSDQRRLVRTGAPIGGQWALEMLSFAVFLVMVAEMGDIAMAASQAFMALLSLSFMQASGLGIAVATLVGRYIGSSELDHAETSFRSGLVLSFFISGTVGLLFLLIPDLLVGIFSDDPEVIQMGIPLLAVGAVFQFFDAFGIVADGALHGAGDTRVPFLIRFLLAWGLFIPLAWLMAFYFEGGLNAAWVAGAIYIFLLAAYLIWRFQSGAWRHIRI